MVRKRKRAQSAMEFLMTYGWAILIMLVVIAILFMLGVFNPKSSIPESCVLPPGFSCYSFRVDSEGKLHLDMGQAKGRTLIVTGISCSAEANASASNLPSQVMLENGMHRVIADGIQCVDENGDAVTSGDSYRGKILIAYHESGSTITRYTRGDISAKLEGGTSGGSGHTPTPTPGGSATPTPTATPTSTATPTPTSTPTPTPTPGISCSEASAPACGGTCPDGFSCNDGGGYCTCVADCAPNCGNGAACFGGSECSAGCCYWHTCDWNGPGVCEACQQCDPSVCCDNMCFQDEPDTCSDCLLPTVRCGRDNFEGVCTGDTHTYDLGRTYNLAYVNYVFNTPAGAMDARVFESTDQETWTFIGGASGTTDGCTQGGGMGRYGEAARYLKIQCVGCTFDYTSLSVDE